mgnify:CR=1 FL=1
MNRLKRIAAWSLLIVLCFSIFPCKVTYAADNGFTIEDNGGNTYSAVATDLVNSVDYTDTNTKIYCVWVPDSVTSLTVKSKKYTNAACHCDNNKITCESNNGELTATVLTETEHDSWCLKESLESGDVAGAESYIDWNSATSLFTVHLMTGEDLDNLGENVMIFVQVGGTKPGSDVTPPELALATDGVERTSDTTATIKFTSNEAGIYYYSLASADVDTSVAGTTMVSGENTLNITGLTAGEVTVYIKARDVIGNVMDVALEVAIPTYVPSYEVFLTLFKPAQKGYRYVSTTADGLPLKSDEVPYTTTYKGAQAGQTIKVTLYIPESDKELETVELVTNDSSATPINVTVNGEENSFSFTMPAANVRAKAFTLKDSLAVRYNLKADVSLLYEDIKDSDGNRQGTVTFTDAAGATLVQAKPGQRVTVTAQPRPYTVGDMFRREFVCWKNAEGISIDEENSTKTSFTFTMPASDVYLFAEVKNVGTEITWGTYPSDVADITIEGLGSKYSPFTFAGDVELDAIPTGEDWWYRYEFTGWTVKRDGTILTDVDTSQLISDDRPEGTFGYATYAKFSVSGKKMTVTANFRERKFASVTAAVNDSDMGSATVAVGTGTPNTNIPAVFEGQTVTLTATPGERYTLKGWEVKDKDNTTVEYRVAEDVDVATFIMPATGKDITAKAIFEVDPAKASTACDLSNVTLDIRGATSERSGTKYTIKVPANTDEAALAKAVLTLEISEYAAVKKTGETDNWPAEGKACGMKLDTPVIFTVTAEDGKTTQDYTVTITRTKSTTKDITAVKLLNADKSVIAEGKLSGTTWTITLPSDTDKALINKIGTSTDVFMQINYTGVSLAQTEGYDDATGIIGKWSSGNVMCGISPNSSKTFTVTAEDGSTKTYTVEIKYTAPNAPTLSGGSATRSSKTAATVKFTSSEAGNYFYKVVDHGAAVPTVDTSKNGTSAVKGENTITLSNLTEDARDIYIVVVNASRGESAALKVEIPAYGSGSETPDTGKFTITINAPKGGTITTNRTKADKGDEIIVTVKPDSGYQMVEGSLTYSLAVAGGETVKITGNRFTMPAGNVTITCKWETATTTAKGITSFSVSGVVGAVNNTTNTITITLPRGTDVTKLTPVIATNGVKSLTPGSGETVDFTNAVTYTAAMEDGSSKTYTVTVYVDKGTLADQFWDKLTDFATQVPWWEYAKHQQSTSKYPKYW